MRFSGQALYQQRLRANMSRSDLAMAIRRASQGQVKATERGVRGWEKGEYAPRSEAMPSIASALGCELIDLYANAESRDEEEDALASSSVDFDTVLRLRLRQIAREEIKAVLVEAKPR